MTKEINESRPKNPRYDFGDWSGEGMGRRSRLRNAGLDPDEEIEVPERQRNTQPSNLVQQ